MEKMINSMIKHYKMFATIGLLIVLVAFFFSLVGSNAQAAFFSADKATREAAGAGSAFVAANIVRLSIPVWVRSLKFLGLGIMLGAITMALGVIATTLRDLGFDIMSKWPADLRSGVPAKPRSAKLFPILMMMGWMFFLIGLIWAFALNGTMISYWTHSIARELYPAAAGSVLLQQLGVIQSSLPWLVTLRFLGMGMVLTAIIIIRTLQLQNNAHLNFAQANKPIGGD